jgi:hypothetical protein
MPERVGRGREPARGARRRTSQETVIASSATISSPSSVIQVIRSVPV